MKNNFIEIMAESIFCIIILLIFCGAFYLCCQEDKKWRNFLEKRNEK